MKDATPQTILLEDYRQPDFWIPKTELRFQLDEEKTVVSSKLSIERNETESRSRTSPLILNGENVVLKSVAVDGRLLAPTEYSLSETHLTVPNVPDHFSLEVVTEIQPKTNLACEGLYISRFAGSDRTQGMFCTQCEAESFRKITYFVDRPDVMSVFTVAIEGDKQRFPLLLSNGNPVSARDLPDGRHEVVWLDPHRKPAYLFALVAGDLGMIEDFFTTRSGRKVKLQIFARHGLQDRCHHAMESLKWSMKWDEDTYGLEYDLDIYMIVVADDFNMGAMENKGLNVFNANYVLAKPETATDHDYDGIMAVVAHEYFHNWTGNRVTCRDWFQLSLKEGLTVFRDQRFSSDLTSEAVKRVEEVIRLRTHQFAEDAGPMAHPIRPQSYITIDNFYTLTIYEKGAEVIRMIETIVGRDGFRKGMDLYFKRHDGQAVTTEDFVAAMSDANGADLKQFQNWYDQAGTPGLKFTTVHDADKETFSVTIEQSCPPSPGQPTKKPYHIPVSIGLLGSDGRDLSLHLSPSQLENGTPLSSPAVSSETQTGQSLVLHLREPQQTFTFTGVKAKPVLSLLRGFTAPVKVEYERSDDELAFLMAHDSDSFARWEAAQTLAIRIAENLVADHSAHRPFRDISQFALAFGPTLKSALQDPAFTSLMLMLPAEQYIAQFYESVNIDAIHAAREHMTREIGRVQRDSLLAIYRRLASDGTNGQGPKQGGLRSLRSQVLQYLTLTDAPADLELALLQQREAKNMTDELGALSALNRSSSPVRRQALDAFYAKWKDEALVMNKWLTIQAIAPAPATLAEVMRLSADPSFDKSNPNKIYSLFVAFAKFNLVRFHDPSGEAYKFIADQVIDIDTRNPQVAARLISAFNQWKSFDQNRQTKMKSQLTRILAQPGLSSNVFEIASKTLNA